MQQTPQCEEQLRRYQEAGYSDRPNHTYSQNLPDAKYAAKAFVEPFGQTPCLRETWNLALSETDGKYRDPRDRFRATRARFWGHVNSGDSADAVAVAAIVTLAGYQLGERQNAPTLSAAFIGAWATPGEVFTVGGRNMASPNNAANLERADRLLSIDHAEPQSHRPWMGLHPDNLRFMSGRDNSTRGNDYPADDVASAARLRAAGLDPSAPWRE